MYGLNPGIRKELVTSSSCYLRADYSAQSMTCLASGMHRVLSFKNCQGNGREMK